MTGLSRLDYVPRNIDLKIQLQVDEIKIDFSSLVLKKGQLYGPFEEIEKALQEGKKQDQKTEDLYKGVTEASQNCKKKQDKVDDLIRDIDKLLS